MKWKLIVRVLEARSVPSVDQSGTTGSYVKLKVGKQKYKTKVAKKCLSPTWGEEFCFRVEDLKEKLVIVVLEEDKYFHDDFVGQVKMTISNVFKAENKSLGTAWYTMQPKKKASKRECGDILLEMYLSKKSSIGDLSSYVDHALSIKKHSDVVTGDSSGRSFNATPSCSSPSKSEEEISSRDEKTNFKEEKGGQQRTLAGILAQMFNKNSDSTPTTSTKAIESPEPEVSAPDASDVMPEDESSSGGSFEELIKTLESKDQGGEIPSSLPGGVLVDQLYLTTPSELNTIIFAPGSTFYRSLTEVQGTTELQIGAWKIENGGDSLKRVVTYLKAATKLIKATKGSEDQTYLKADGKAYAVLASVSTPDVMYGNTFKVELMYCLTPGPELPSGEQCARLVISWRVNFVQSTMMKGFIENGARQGLKDGFEEYASILSQNVKPVDSSDIGSNKEQALASLQGEPQSDWKLALQYFANFTVVSTVVVVLYVLVHVWLSPSSAIQGLEFVGLDLPDSLGELIVSGILALQGERVLQLVSRFLQARRQKGSDHGVKAQGDGWLLTAALIEGNDLAAVDSSGFCDPYVVFTCNGKTRSSSIKFQNCNPLWNELFEFDAMDDPPSVLEVEVYDFDGPFAEATSLGHAEINFVRCNISDLADVSIPLQGKLAQACQSKLHLRIFLDNSKGDNVVREYLTKMEKEVGKKINIRSPQTNSAFQKLFGLPPEEFLINDFTCHLRRKMPLQGRLFLSARIIGFHANLFGHKTRFFFLWEDIEDIQVFPPTLVSMGSPIFAVTLRPGRGTEAKHGAKTQDEEGRLKFQFHSFVSFNVAQRTIMALWKARALSPEQKAQIAEEESEAKLQHEESGSFLGLEDVTLSEIYSSSLPVPPSFCMELFGGGEMDRKAMERAGCHNYSFSPWESEKADVYVREIYYRFDRSISRYGGEVTSTMQKSSVPEKNIWLVEEVMNLHGVPLGEYFNVHLRYQIEEIPMRPKVCHVRVFFGIAWLKSTRHQKRIAKNIFLNLQDRPKVIFGVIEKEFSNR